MSDVNDYQKWTATTSVFKVKDALSYLVLGMTGEAGEIANKVKKILRDKDGVMDEPTRQMLIDELGDVMWYIAQFAAYLGTDLSEVLARNQRKLEDRKSRNQISGSGDNR